MPLIQVQMFAGRTPQQDLVRAPMRLSRRQAAHTMQWM